MKLIGVTGVAGSGKDTFCRLLAKELANRSLKCKNYSLAEELKIETKEFCIKNYNIDPTNCTREQKQDIRDFLVFHGNYKRKMTNGRYWNEILENKINKDAFELDYVTISDIRYNQYDFDEYWFLKDKCKGILVHVSCYEKIVDGIPYYIQPANDQEFTFDPRMKRLSDFQVRWPKIGPEYINDLNTHLLPFVREFLNNYLNKK